MTNLVPKQIVKTIISRDSHKLAKEKSSTKKKKKEKEKTMLTKILLTLGVLIIERIDLLKLWQEITTRKTETIDGLTPTDRYPFVQRSTPTKAY